MVHERSAIPAEKDHRKHLHTRVVTYRGYARQDGLWEIDGHLRDTKGYLADSADGSQIGPDVPVHEMTVCVTVNDELIIQNVFASMPSTPFSDCAVAMQPLQVLVGATLGRGWRKTIESRIGGTASCTHLRELLLNLATAAIQTIPPYLAQFRDKGEQSLTVTQKPFYVDQCYGWRSGGEAVIRLHPEFSTPVSLENNDSAKNDENPRRTYTPAFREQAIALVAAQRLTLADAAMQLDVPKGTLANWIAAAKRAQRDSAKAPIQDVTRPY